MKIDLNVKLMCFQVGFLFFIIMCIQKEYLEVSYERELVEERVRMIRVKYMDGRSMIGRDRRTFERFEGEEKFFIRRERYLQVVNFGWFNKCFKCCRLFEVVFGVIFLLFGLFIIVLLFFIW